MGTQKWNETCKICAVGRVTFSFAVDILDVHILQRIEPQRKRNRIQKSTLPCCCCVSKLWQHLYRHTHTLTKNDGHAFCPGSLNSGRWQHTCIVFRCANRVIEFYNRFNSMFILSISNSWRTRVSSPSWNVFGFKTLLFFSFPLLCCRFQLLSTQRTRTRTHTLCVPKCRWFYLHDRQRFVFGFEIDKRSAEVFKKYFS